MISEARISLQGPGIPEDRRQRRVKNQETDVDVKMSNVDVRKRVPMTLTLMVALAAPSLFSRVTLYCPASA